jgi:hypothetical protein
MLAIDLYGSLAFVRPFGVATQPLKIGYTHHAVDAMVVLVVFLGGPVPSGCFIGFQPYQDGFRAVLGSDRP